MSAKRKRPERERSRGEELANSLTHGVGALLGCAALSLLVVFSSLRGSAWHIVSTSIYGATLVVMYTCSAAYHLFRREGLKRFFRTLDHAAIFLLIAGTYTPFLLVTLRDGALGWVLFGVMWGLALAGVILECTLTSRFRALSVPIYIAMGWMAVFALRPLLENLSASGMCWVFVGGLAYTVGVIFYVLKRVPYAHTVWHIFVLGGSVCHFFAVMFYVVPRG